VVLVARTHVAVGVAEGDVAGLDGKVPDQAEDPSAMSRVHGAEAVAGVGAANPDTVLEAHAVVGLVLLEVLAAARPFGLGGRTD